MASTFKCTQDNGNLKSIKLVKSEDCDSKAVCIRTNIASICSDTLLPTGCRNGLPMQMFLLFLILLTFGKTDSGLGISKIIFIVPDNLPAKAAHRLHLLCNWTSWDPSRVFLVEWGLCAFCDFLDKEPRNTYGEVSILYLAPGAQWRCHSWAYKQDKFITCSQEQYQIATGGPKGECTEAQPSTQSRRKLLHGLNELLAIARRSERMILCCSLLPSLEECPHMAGSYFEFFNTWDVTQGASFAANALVLGRLSITHPKQPDFSQSRKHMVFNASKKSHGAPFAPDKWQTFGDTRVQFYVDGTPREIQRKVGSNFVTDNEWITGPPNQNFLQGVKSLTDLVVPSNAPTSGLIDAKENNPTSCLQDAISAPRSPTRQLSPSCSESPSLSAPPSDVVRASASPTGAPKNTTEGALPTRASANANRDLRLPSGMRLTPELAQCYEATRADSLQNLQHSEDLGKSSSYVEDTEALPVVPSSRFFSQDSQSVPDSFTSMESLTLGWQTRLEQQIERLSELEAKLPDAEVRNQVERAKSQIQRMQEVAGFFSLFKSLLETELDHSLRIIEDSDMKRVVATQTPAIVAECEKFVRLTADDRCSIQCLRPVLQGLSDQLFELQNDLTRIVSRTADAKSLISH
eukprot:Gregarina_sp_Poly_1__2735@NODE_1756_length_3399_cov_39_623049_g1147_i0_p1_GENE_NODE_1756_length_3399_cov_39_623049_g1147_i0NODE_1756_length_3399_cov_39_623049_g1147_i0_p1_ORF_typecomplete_len633_score88_86YgaB/PF14182_6/1_2e04YgaB/PF14182_6/0_51YgaB/PF14182_6/1e04_NODE_1756_length_3399_cov_39_623049_g1147_i01662064